MYIICISFYITLGHVQVQFLVHKNDNEQIMFL